MYTCFVFTGRKAVSRCSLPIAVLQLGIPDCINSEWMFIGQNYLELLSEKVTHIYSDTGICAAGQCF